MCPPKQESFKRAAILIPGRHVLKPFTHGDVLDTTLITSPMGGHNMHVFSNPWSDGYLVNDGHNRFGRIYSLVGNATLNVIKIATPYSPEWIAHVKQVLLEKVGIATFRDFVAKGNAGNFYTTKQFQTLLGCEPF
jgi:hypothetical protein